MHPAHALELVYPPLRIGDYDYYDEKDQDSLHKWTSHRRQIGFFSESAKLASKAFPRYSVNFALVSMCERKVFSGTSFILVESFMSNLTGSTPIAIASMIHIMSYRSSSDPFGGSVQQLYIFWLI